KPIWNRIFFSNTYDKMKWPRAEIDQFWLFVQKYSKAQNQSKDSRHKQRKMGEKLLAKWSASVPDEWKDVDFLYSKVEELHYQKYIDSDSIREFREVALMFVDFNQGRKVKKSEKLKV